MKVLYKVALRHHLGVSSKKGAVFFPRCLSGVPATPGYPGLGFLPVLCSRTQTEAQPRDKQQIDGQAWEQTFGLDSPGL